MDASTSAVAFLLLIPLGLALQWCLNMATLRGAVESPRTIFLARTAPWMMVASGVLSMALFAMGLFAIPFLFLLLVVNQSLAARQEIERSQMLTQLIGAMLQRGCQLPPALQALGLELSGEFGLRVQSLAEAIAQGMPLAAALRASRIRVGLETQLAARVGDSEVAATLLAGEHARMTATRSALRHGFEALAYVTFVAAAAGLLVEYLSNELIPSVVSLNGEVGGTWVTTGIWLTRLNSIRPLLTVLGVVLVAISLLGACYYAGWVRVEPPGAEWLIRGMHRGRIYEYLAAGTRLGRPLPEILEQLQQGYPRRRIRARLKRVLQDVQQGSDWIGSMGRHGLATGPEEGVMRAAERASNLSWALGEMAVRADRRMQSRWETAIRIAVPISIVLLAIPCLLVGLVVLGAITGFIYSLV